jgi:GTPase SAR1 family protein
MYLIFIVGTAGSGKSLFTASYAQWLLLKGQRVSTVNLDAAATYLPYSPDVDVRDFFRAEELMRKYNLGPNGAIVMAADLIATEIETIGAIIAETVSDFIIIDTPGQLELFAFRASGTYIVDEITTEPKAMVYLFDATFSSSPINYISNMFLATAIHTRFLVPQIYALSKTDMIEPKILNMIISWSQRASALEDALQKEHSEIQRIMGSDVARIISRLGLSFPIFPISSKNMEGFNNIHALITRIFTGGDEII